MEWLIDWLINQSRLRIGLLMGWEWVQLLDQRLKLVQSIDTVGLGSRLAKECAQSMMQRTGQLDWESMEQLVGQEVG